MVQDEVLMNVAEKVKVSYAIGFFNKYIYLLICLTPSLIITICFTWVDKVFPSTSPHLIVFQTDINYIYVYILINHFRYFKLFHVWNTTIQNFAVIYCVDIDEVPEFSGMYELCEWRVSPILFIVHALSAI